MPSTSAPADPPIPDELRAEARRRPGGWLYKIDPAFDPAGRVPPYGDIGGWQVDQHGEIVRFVHNPNYRPSPAARRWATPANALEAALQAAAAGHGSEEDLAAAFLDAELLVFAKPEAGRTRFFVQHDAQGRQVLEACTSAHYVPAHWEGSTTMTGRSLAALGRRMDVRLNPGSAPSVTLPLDQLTDPGRA